jgi:Ca2+-binding RTX toxin-like protein
MHVERLENRRLLSVTVTEGYPGFYEIWGDESANAIAVSVSMAAETFTLNGVTYSGVSYIAVYGYGGEDTISVVADGAGSIGAAVSAGDGSDDITANFSAAIWAGAGSDTLNLADSFRGEAYGEGGDDWVVVSGECVEPEIHGGTGDDVIDASGNNYGVVIHGGWGDDAIYGSLYDDQLYGEAGSDTLYGGSGVDLYFE